MIDLMLGDCRERMATLEPDSVDSIVTDPPYGLSFMGKGWDHGVPGVEFWTEALRVAKPGAHLLAFGGTRTFHRLACAIEDAGWKIRDCVMWVYGCLDDQTRVATSEGVKPYHKTKVGDTVLCYDPDNGEYTYQPILEIVEYEYSDTAYRLIGDFGEQVVSRNHRVIVERGGKEVFDLAENVARQQQARIPILENLPELRKTLSDAEQIAGHAEQDVQRGLRKDAYQQSEIGSSSDANESAEGQDGQLCGLRGAGLEAGRLVAEDKQADMQQGVPFKDRMTGETNPAWKGGLTYRNRKGAYANQSIKYVQCPQHLLSMARKDGYVMEHRLVVALAMGRPLTRSECVHHINHDATDNRLPNLMLFKTNGEHKAFEHGAAIKPLWCGLCHSTTPEKSGACACRQEPLLPSAME